MCLTAAIEDSVSPGNEVVEPLTIRRVLLDLGKQTPIRGGRVRGEGRGQSAGTFV